MEFEDGCCNKFEEMERNKTYKIRNHNMLFLVFLCFLRASFGLYLFYSSPFHIASLYQRPQHKIKEVSPMIIYPAAGPKTTILWYGLV